MSITSFVLLPDPYGATSQTLVLAEDQLVLSIGPRYPLLLILRHSSTVYLFVAMIYFDMDPLCIFCGHACYFIYITWIHCVLFVAMDYSYISHIPWIHSVLDLAAMLISLLSMGMPDLGREYSYLMSVDGCCSWISCSGTFTGLLQCILASQSL
jgi:hypothetical protein